jgi:phosphonate transport system ATP-binding protein
VAVARLLVQRPELVMADEPTASVDPRSARIVLAALDRLAAGGSTLLLATHDLQIARRHDRIVALHAGRTAFAGTPADLHAEDVERVYGADPSRWAGDGHVQARGCR